MAKPSTAQGLIVNSYFAKPGHHCFHNVNYWQFRDYLGIGAGAYSKLYMDKALAGSAIAQETEVSRADLPFTAIQKGLDGGLSGRLTKRPPQS